MVNDLYISCLRHCIMEEKRSYEECSKECEEEYGPAYPVDEEGNYIIGDEECPKGEWPGVPLC